eukprot:CAMPEP_0184869104 /NCGR_PEP_ID=MMETSP0580-20130426/32884_1 /TAXON_ID=1118495 /ORGANISM="Dactyliosolen fragilissimus" /LENGTH=527 /DNA_ID=CAMNT_0027370373 /DNA_START=110 /DNA_END=1690 /DNA_ORIENTATION=+
MKEAIWTDRLKTRLNACSLEVLQNDHNFNAIGTLCDGDGDRNIADNGKDTRQMEDECNRSYHQPLVIGCYQLNEGSATNEGDTKKLESQGEDEHDGNRHNDQKEEDDKNASSSENNSRSGELRLYTISPKEETLKFGEPAQILETDSGVLDGKWFRRLCEGSTESSPLSRIDLDQSRSVLFATACASGKVNFYRLIQTRTTENSNNKNMDSHSSSLQYISSTQSWDSGGLCLSIAWDDYTPSSLNIDHTFSNDEGNTTSTRIVSSYSGGQLAVHNIHFLSNAASRHYPFNSQNNHNNHNNHNNNNNDRNITDNTQAIKEREYMEIEETHRWNAHTLFKCPSEVWTTCFATNSNYNTYHDTIISGGDDCKLKLWDLRTNLDTPTHVVGESEFEAGVTSVAFHPTLDHIFASGSYDEGIRIWDMRYMTNNTKPLLRIPDLGGGIWRIKWHPEVEGKILIAAMHGGCRILNIPNFTSSTNIIDDQPATIDILSSFTEHESMAYGADWILSKNNNEVAASCSFYDRQGFIW